MHLIMIICHHIWFLFHHIWHLAKARYEMLYDQIVLHLPPLCSRPLLPSPWCGGTEAAGRIEGGTERVEAVNFFYRFSRTKREDRRVAGWQESECHSRFKEVAGCPTAMTSFRIIWQFENDLGEECGAVRWPRRVGQWVVKIDLTDVWGI